MTEQPPLWDRMRAYEPRRDDFVELADAFEAAANGFYGEPQTHSAKQFLGAMARARLKWCEVTGEPLV